MDRADGATTGSINYEDLRILQLAVELYQLGLTTDSEERSLAVTPTEPEPVMFNVEAMNSKCQLIGGKKQLVTEYVPVPTSEHVAEIIGRQGCKIKQLRSRSSAYIKTPERGDEPVFIVTGRKQDVELAKQEILRAAEHFSSIRALRKHETLPFPPPSVSGLVTVEMRVPYVLVGLVVGPKGSTIKHIQELTNTYIVTPSRDSDPVFEVTGLPGNVERAQREIQDHIAFRTGQFGQVHRYNFGMPEIQPENYINNWNGSLNTPTSTDDSFSGFWSEEGSVEICGKGGESISSSLSSLSCQGFGGNAQQDSGISSCRSGMTLNQPLASAPGSFSEYHLFHSEPPTTSRSASGKC